MQQLDSFLSGMKHVQTEHCSMQRRMYKQNSQLGIFLPGMKSAQNSAPRGSSCMEWSMCKQNSLARGVSPRNGTHKWDSICSQGALLAWNGQNSIDLRFQNETDLLSIQGITDVVCCISTLQVELHEMHKNCMHFAEDIIKIRPGLTGCAIFQQKYTAVCHYEQITEVTRTCLSSSIIKTTHIISNIHA